MGSVLHHMPKEKAMRYLLSGIGLLTLAGSIVSSPALADQNLDCDTYAAAAIKQQV